MGNANAPEAIKTFTSSGYTVTRAPYDSASFSGIGKTLSHTKMLMSTKQLCSYAYSCVRAHTY